MTEAIDPQAQSEHALLHGVPGSVRHVETIARAQGDVLVQRPPLNADDLVQTAQELAQLANYLSEVSTARSQFLSKVAHELRTPLTIMKGWMSMLGHGQLDAEQQRIIAIVDQQIGDLTRLTADLLDLSRREAASLVLNLEEVHLLTLVQHVVEHRRELVSLQGIQIGIEAHNPDMYVCVDRGRIAQVLNNLIDNACRYVSHSGNGRIDLVLADVDATACVSVHDNGVGIAPEHLPRIFEPFYQINSRNRGKSGLGLAITHELVQAHGGSLTVESTPGQGTTFHIWLRHIAQPSTIALPQMEEAA